MRFNAYNRGLGAAIDRIEQDRVAAPVTFEGGIPPGIVSAAEIKKIFAISTDSPLAIAGCQLRYANGDLMCEGRGAPIGALLPNGEWFDLELPFRFPFTEVLQKASAKAQAEGAKQ
jgi:hypothetical protein